VKLLYVLPEYVLNAGGGIITFYRHFLPLLARQGHEVRVIVGSGVHAEESPSPVVIDGVRVESLSLGLLRKYSDQFAHYAAMPGLRRYLAAAWAMHEQAEGGQGYDLVEAADWGLLFAPWVVKKGPPCMVQLHGSSGQIEIHDPVAGEELQGHVIRLIERCAVHAAIGAQAYSHANTEFWRRQTGRDVERILPAWRPLVELPEGGARSQRGLVVGRLQRWKGPEILCEALQLLGDRAPATDWVGRDTAYLHRNQRTSEHLSKTWPSVWGKRLVHKAQQPAEAIQRLQAEAAFIVVPSLWDTFNFTCVEAMGAGTPVICSTGAGASDLIQDGINGFVFTNGRPQELAAAIDRLLSMSPATRRTMVEAGRETVHASLSPVSAVGQRVAAYESAIRRGQQPELPDGDWLRMACAPGESHAGDLTFLDQLPLRPLAEYTLRRIAQKLARRW
jgi:glycosyltransferase involved in cell wall biosynthesis